LWKELYTAAMLELDPATLRSRIEAAQTAIRNAKRELANDRSVSALEEMQAMTDALHGLETLQRIEFKTSVPATIRGQAQGGGIIL